MAPTTVELIGKKKRRREKMERTSSSVVVPSACEQKQMKRRVQRENPQAPGACTPLSLI
jgi:predicted alternative tryptophan synthase beta-subunit